MYIRDVQGGFCDPKADCKVEKETVATALVNGNNGFGAVVGQFSMDMAIKKAKDVGIGIVVAYCKYFINLTLLFVLKNIIFCYANVKYHSCFSCLFKKFVQTS